VQGSTPVSEGCDRYHPLLLPWLSLGPALRYLTPTGRVPQLSYPSRCTRGRFQAAESQPRRNDRKLWQPTNYDRCYAKVHCKLRRRATSICPMEIYHAKLIANGESCQLILGGLHQSTSTANLQGDNC